MGENPAAAGVAVILWLLAALLIISAIRGTYYGVWQSLRPGATATATASGTTATGGGSHTVR